MAPPSRTMWCACASRTLIWTSASLVLLLVLAVSPLLRAQEVSSPPASAFNIETASRAYLDRLPPDKKARSDAYFEGGYWLQLWQFLYSAALAVLLLQTGLSVRM